MEKKFKSNELVWAKIRGFPWWPAIVGNISYDSNSEKKILVYFIGDTSHAELPDSKIEKFDLKYAEFSKTRQRSLINSINIANEISRGSDGVLKEIDLKNLNYNFNFQFNSKKNKKQISKNGSLASTGLSHGNSGNTDNALISGGAGCEALNKEANLEDKAANRKSSGDKRKNSFVNGNANSNGLGANSNNTGVSNGLGNLNGSNSDLDSKGASHIESPFANMNVNNSNINCNSKENNNNTSRFYSSDNLRKSFSGSSLNNVAANGNCSLDSIISLNDSEPSFISNNNTTTLALNEASNSGYLANTNNAKSKGNLNSASDSALNHNKNTNNNNNNYFNNRMEALNDKHRKNSNCNSLANNNKDKQQCLSLPDIDKKISLCPNSSEAANKSTKNNSNHLELLNCLKQKELEILKAQQISEKKNDEKMLNKKRLKKSKRLRLKSKLHQTDSSHNSDQSDSESNCEKTNPEKSSTIKKPGNVGNNTDRAKKNKFNFDSNFSYYFVPKRSSRTRRKNKLFFSEEENSSEKESEDEAGKNSQESDCSSDSGENEEIELRKQLKAQLNELVFYKIEMPSASSNKKIISCIERIIEIINIISHSNQRRKKSDLSSSADRSLESNDDKADYKKEKLKFKDFNFYEMFKEIFPILICLSHHKNSDIAQKIYELNSLIKKNIIADIFELNNVDLTSEKYTCKMLIDECDSEAKNPDSKAKEIIKPLNAVVTNKNSMRNNSHRKSSESDKQSILLLEDDEKKFDLKIEALKKLIVQELAENLKLNQVKGETLIDDVCPGLAGNQVNNASLLRNQSTAKAKDKLPLTSEKSENQPVNNFSEKVNFDKKTDKIKLNKNALNINNNSACNDNSAINNSFGCSNNNTNNNKNSENNKSGFFNSKEENKKDSFNKENIYNYENCVIDNTNMLTTETYNIDSSILSIKENNLICVSSNYHSTRLRRNSSLDYKEKNCKDNIKRKCSTNSKSDLKMKKGSKSFFEISKSDETNSLEDVSSSNYTGTSRMESEEFRSKFKAIPLSNKELYNLVCEFGGKIIPEMSEEDFLTRLQDDFYFKNIREANLDLGIFPVKNTYLRKTVCIELFKVLLKLFKHLDFDIEKLKTLIVLIEFNARVKDPEMSHTYKDYIRSIYQNIKMTIHSKIGICEETKV